MTSNISKALMLQSKKTENEKYYWTNKLSGELVKTYFPYDYITPDAPAYKNDNFHFRIPVDNFPKLMQLAKGSDNNIYIILLTCLAILLNKYSGNKDIIVATPIYKQDIDGEFINTSLAVRLQLTGAESVKELIIVCKKTVFEANEHLNFPVERFLNDLKLTLSGNKYSFFDTGILLENIHYKKYIEHLHLTMLFSFLKTDEGIEGVLEYNPQLYKKNTIERIAARFNVLLDKIVNNPNLQILEIELLSEEERYQLLTNFNQTQIDYPKDKTIHKLFEEQVENRGENIAIVGEGYKGFLGYKELNERANRLGRLLREKGIKAGDIVAISAPPSIRTIVAILAVLKAGAAYLPIDPDFPEERINFILKDSQTHLYLTSNFSNDQLTCECESINIYDESIFPKEGSNLEAISTPRDVIYVIYTSGTSGRPKGALIKNENLVNYTSWFLKKVGLTKDDKAVLLSSFAFDLGYTSIYPSILAGGELHIMPKETFLVPDSLLGYVEENKITYMKLTPSLFSIFVNSTNFIKEKLLSLKLVVLGGEPINTNDVERARLLCDHIQIMNHYGPTETTIGVIARLIDFGHFEEYKLNPDIGKPIDNAEVYILDENSKLVPIGIAAELYIGGNSVGIGYLNQPELTSRKFIVHPFHRSGRLYQTGDRARWAPDGNIEFLGRIDSQVKVRGFRIEVEEIENQLIKQGCISNAVVVAREDGNGGRYLCAYYVSSVATDAAALREYLSLKLPLYMIPSVFMALNKIPVTPNGKVDRRALPEPEFIKDSQYAPPQDALQEKLSVLWSKVLGLKEENISIDASFFELGGDSLKATTLIAKIHKECDTQVPLLELFKSPTIRGLSEIINRTTEDKYVSIDPVEEKEYYTVSSAQRRLYFLQQLYNNTSYNLSMVLSIEGDIDINKLNMTFRKLLSRHESLRTSFEIVNDELVQRIHKTVEFNIQYHDLHPNRQETEKILKKFVIPFDLSCAPLMRVGLIKTMEKKYIMCIDMHHIVRDGHSEEILRREFIALYAEEALPPLRLQYKDFSEWQNGEKQKENLKLQKEYWLKEFEGEIPILDIPTDYPRPLEQSFEGNCVDSEIIEEETKALKTMALSEGYTLFMILIAIYNILLFKLSGQEDIVIGTPIAGRRHADLDKIIGMFVNTLSLRNYPAGHRLFSDFLREVKERLLMAFENQEYSFEELVDSLMVKRDPGRNPLFDITFALHSVDTGLSDQDKETEIEISQSSQIYSPEEFENLFPTVTFDLILNVLEGSTLSLSLHYCTKLFKKETIERFITYFKKIVSIVTKYSEIPISDIEIISDEEKNQILYEFNDTKVAYPKGKTISQLFEEQVATTPYNIAVIGPSVLAIHNTHLQITYDELNKKSDRLARKLIEDAVQSGEVVGIMMERSIEMVIGILGIWAAGGAYMPIDPGTPQERINYMLKDSRAKRLVTTNDKEGEKIGKWEGEKVFLAEILKSPKISSSLLPFLPSYLQISSNLAYIIYTSGTTGKPKGAMVEQIGMLNHMQAKINTLEITGKSNIAQNASHTFDISVWQFFAALVKGGTTIIYPENVVLDPWRFIDRIIKDRVTILEVVPSYLSVLLDTVGPQYNLPLCYLLVTGEEVKPILVDRWFKMFPGIKMVNAYGPTEASDDITHFLMENASDMERIPLGKPVQNFNIFIIDDNMNLCPVGVQGELCVCGIGVGKGYINRPEMTAERFISLEQARLSSTLTLSNNTNTLYKTGDLAKWLPDGNIEFLGRKDYQVKIRGFRIELGEIENHLARLEGIKEAIVIDRKDKKGEKYLCAYLTGIEGRNKIPGVLELKESLSKVLPDSMIPSYFVPMEKLPLTSNGKIDRKALPEPTYSIRDIPYISEEMLKQLQLKSKAEKTAEVIEVSALTDSQSVELTEEDKSRILYEFNNTRAEFPSNKTLHRFLEEQVGKTPDNTAIVGLSKHVTYGEFNKKSNQLAARIIEKGGKPEDIVGVGMVTRSIEIIAGIFAVLKAGCAYMAISLTYPDKRIDFISRDSGIKVVLTDNGREFSASGQHPLVIDVTNEHSYASANGNPMIEMTSHSAAAVFYTSGSTGNPKGVVLEHTGLVNRLYWMQKIYPLDTTDVILQKTPYIFDVSMWELFFWSQNGASLYLMPPDQAEKPQDVLTAIKKAGVTTTHFTPTSMIPFLHFIESTRELKNLAVLKRVFSSGEALSPGLVDRFNRLLYSANGTRLYNLYGPTEASIEVSCFECAMDKPVEIVPIGKPIHNIQLHIIDKSLRIVPIGVVGELCIAGIALARGYLNRPEKTAENFIIPGHDRGQAWLSSSLTKYTKTFYKTGDLARWLPDGNIEFLGRADQQVQIHGIRIEVGEIESVLLRHRDIKEAVVIPRSIENEEFSLCAFLVAVQDLGKSDFKDTLTRELPHYMIPTQYVELEKLPLTPSGKIDRKTLGLIEFTTNREVEYIAPRTEMESQIADIWKEILKLDKVSVHDNFFELGGNSLNTISLTSAIRNAGYQIALADILSNQTIEELASIVTAKNAPEKSVEDLYEDAILSNLECIEKLNNGHNKKKIFIIHPLHGMVNQYKELALLLEKNYNVYGIQARGVQPGSIVAETPRQMVDDYIEQILAVQKEGPFIISGYCIGVRIAYDIVLKLEQMNHSIEKLILFDSAAFFTDRAVMIRRRLNYFPGFVKKLMVFFSEKDFKKRIKVKNSSNIDGREAEKIKNGEDLRKEKLAEYLSMMGIYFLHLEFIKAPILVPQAINGSNAHFVESDYNKMTKSKATVVQTPGDHESIWGKPYVEKLAEIIINNVGS